MTEKKSYDEVRVDRFSPNHSIKVQFERHTRKPSDTGRVKLTRDEALWLVCQHLHEIVDLEAFMSMGQYGSSYGRSIQLANARIAALMESGLIDEAEVKAGYDQILRGSGGPFEREPMCDCEQCASPASLPALKLVAPDNTDSNNDLPF